MQATPRGGQEEVIRYVCLPGCGFTGSTLLGFLLNTRPDCASIGAATGLIADVDLETYRCSCGALFRECRFWSRVAERTRELGHPVDPFRTGFWATYAAPTGSRWIDALLVRSLRSSLLNEARDRTLGRLAAVRRSRERAADASWALARAVLDLTGARVFLDTARDHQRPRLLRDHPRLEVRAIHLVRDVRANSASLMKHLGLSDAAAAARHWRRANLEADRARRHLLPEHWLRLRYDALCADPQGTLDRIAAFLELPPAPLPADFRSVEHHIIGNPMRLGGPGAVREDLSWKERLSAADLARIARVAGADNRAFGFAWP